ncbi:MAG: sulfatase-like hydrolase/transferase, partial [Muribaculaceae bacterium]|nr:sulfatase-like hydrolase/transferase [Muribaculaceae bacterium]
MTMQAYAQERPNIIFFLVDDYGWTETSLPFGEETYPRNKMFRTPNMERLAKKGVMLTNAYACSLSTPTRTCLMTGMNSAHMGITSFSSLYKDIVP